MAQLRCSNCGGLFNTRNCLSCSIVGSENEFVHDPNPLPYDNTTDFSFQPPQHHVDTYLCELCGNDSHYVKQALEKEQNPSEIIQELLLQLIHDLQLLKKIQPKQAKEKGINKQAQKKQEEKCIIELLAEEQAARINFLFQDHNPSQFFISLDGDDDYDKESIISTYTDIFKTPLSDAITTSPPVLQIEDPQISLITGNVEINAILEKESNEFIKSSVEDLVPIPSESGDASGSDSECILPSCDYFSTNDIPEEESVTFSIPLFNSNNDFTSSDDESLSDEDVLKDNVLENIESKDSYDSNLDEPDLLVTPLFDVNKDECFDPGDDVNKINDFEDGHYDSEGDILYLESFINDDLVHRYPSIPTMSVSSILEGFADEPPLEGNDDLFDLEYKNDEWKKILYDAQIDDLMSEDKIFDPGFM
nr:hypothetical protein [Tanacetum cinerariifolium]